jgi:hypothetical protein
MAVTTPVICIFLMSTIGVVTLFSMTTQFGGATLANIGEYLFLASGRRLDPIRVSPNSRAMSATSKTGFE